MKLSAMRDVGALVRSARRERGLTQAELAALVGVGREWVVRLEGGSPRVEAQKVLDVLSALGLSLDVSPSSQASARPPAQRAKKKPSATSTTLKVPGKAKRSTSVAKSGSSGRWVVKSTTGAKTPTTDTAGFKKQARSVVGSSKASPKRKSPSTAKSSRGDRDPFDALFSQKGR